MNPAQLYFLYFTLLDALHYLRVEQLVIDRVLRTTDISSYCLSSQHMSLALCAVRHRHLS